MIYFKYKKYIKWKELKFVQNVKLKNQFPNLVKIKDRKINYIANVNLALKNIAFYIMKKNKEKLNGKNRIYRTNNQEYITLYSKQYFQKNKKEIIDKRKQRRHTIPYVKFCHNMRSLTNRAFKIQNVTKDYKFFELLGCSHSFFKNWISFQLYGNMSMENDMVKFGKSIIAYLYHHLIY